jgi:hypothetical protein
MHRALLVSEILLGVFMHLMTVTSDQPLYEESVTYWHEFDYRKFFSTKNTLSSDHNRYLTRLSFAALARTCKTFHEPAMDFLWADTGNHGIGPLLGCVTRLHPLIYYYRHDGKVSAASQTFFRFSVHKLTSICAAAGPQLVRRRTNI